MSIVPRDSGTDVKEAVAASGSCSEYALKTLRFLGYLGTRCLYDWPAL